MRYLSVCSGIEAATVAWHPLGWRPVAFSEIDRFPRAVLRHRQNAVCVRETGAAQRGVPMFADFTCIRPRILRRIRIHEPIDLLVGGTPCQSFSVAGLRGGLDDERGNLALEYFKLARRLRARWIVWENVPGVLSSNEGRDFGSILGALVELGYGFAYRILDAQYFGVPQRRRRVFVVGYLGDWRPAAAVLFERESLRRNPPPRREAGTGVAALTANGVGTCGADDNQGQAGHLLPVGIDGGADIGHALTASRAATGRPDPDGQTFVAHTLRGEGFDASEDGTGRGTPLVPIPFDTTQVTSSGNYSQPKAGDQCHPLAAGSHAPAIAFHGSQDPDVSGHVTHPVGRNRGQETCVAFQCHGSNVGPMGTLRAGNGNETGGVPCVVIQEIGKRTGRSTDDKRCGLGISEDGAPMFSLQAGAQHGVATDMAVRRLTPRECERLQGFPDDFTKIPWRGKPADQCPDGPRYKALGNSMAVPVMRWIGERIQDVEQILQSKTEEDRP